MKKPSALFKLSLLAAMVGSLTLLPAATCLTPQQKSVLNEVLTDTQKACVLANAFLPDDDVLRFCAIDAVLVPAVRPLLAEHRAKAAAYYSRMAAARALDAGAD